jgi:hypothetical protein
VTVANNNFSLFSSLVVHCDETFYYFPSLPERLQDFLSLEKSFYCCLFRLQTTTTAAAAAASTQGNRPLNIFTE